MTLAKQNVSGDLIDDMLTGRIIGSPWNKFIRKSLITESGVSFASNLDFCEDICFYTDICLHYKNHLHVRYLPCAFYYYNMDNVSLTRRPVLEHKDSIMKYVDYLSRKLGSEKYTFLSNKFGIKWAMLKGNIGWAEYSTTYPEIFNLLSKPAGKKFSLIKRIIMRATKYLIPFIIIRLFLSFTEWTLKTIKCK